MSKTRIKAIVTVSKLIELELDYSLNPQNQRQMDTVKDELEVKFHLNTNIVRKEYDVIDIVKVNLVAPDIVS